ncbi:hypothetical protein F5Y14DRAFT_463253 [Nemania sp. NC0429]|nr:hypothetical protein F5Y14DRAFT_463253 [Nemania sp. NC0429]
MAQTLATLDSTGPCPSLRLPNKIENKADKLPLPSLDNQQITQLLGAPAIPPPQFMLSEELYYPRRYSSARWSLALEITPDEADFPSTVITIVYPSSSKPGCVRRQTGKKLENIQPGARQPGARKTRSHDQKTAGQSFPTIYQLDGNETDYQHDGTPESSPRLALAVASLGQRNEFESSTTRLRENQVTRSPGKVMVPKDQAFYGDELRDAGLDDETPPSLCSCLPSLIP